MAQFDLRPVVAAFEDKVKTLRERRDFAAARDFCAATRDTCSRVFFEYTNDPEPMLAETDAMLGTLVAEGALLVNDLRVDHAQKGELVNELAAGSELRLRTTVKEKAKLLRKQKDFIPARDLCAAVREWFCRYYAEYEFKPSTIPDEDCAALKDLIAEARTLLRELRLNDPVQQRLVRMYAESVDFRLKMLTDLLNDNRGPSVVCRQEISEIQLQSCVPFGVDDSTESSSFMRLASNIGVEMFKDHGPPKHACETFVAIMKQFLILDLPRLRLGKSCNEVEKSIREVSERLAQPMHEEDPKSEGRLKAEADVLCAVVTKEESAKTTPFILAQARKKLAESIEDPKFVKEYAGKTVVFWGDKVFAHGDDTQGAYLSAMNTALTKCFTVRPDQLTYLAVPPLVFHDADRPL